MLRFLCVIALSCCASLAVAQETRSSLESTITGNQEQPQVSYIVPWQNPESPELDYDLTGGAAGGVFDHLEPEELRRQLKALPEVEPARQLPLADADTAETAIEQTDE